MRRKLLLAFMLLLFLSTVAYSQAVQVKQLSRLRVSDELRADLAERLNLFIEYELTEQYEKQYDLVWKQCPVEDPCVEISREEYVNRQRKIQEIYGKMVELKFKGIDRKLEGNFVPLRLIPKFRQGKDVYTNLSSAVAVLHDGTWYFSFALVEI